MLTQLPIFPCDKTNKSPLVSGGFKSARRGARPDRWPLIGFATGQASGIDVLDVDPSGVDWYSANFDALPQPRAHQTQRGLHLLFKHAAGLRCSTARIAPGIDVRADGGYAIYWPREGLPFEDHPVSEWPDWLLREAMAPRRSVGVGNKGNRSTYSPDDGRGKWAEALFKLDPVCWRGRYERWFELMMACKAVGISAEKFVEWSTQDEVYSADAEVIARLWESAPTMTSRCVYGCAERSGDQYR